MDVWEEKECKRVSIQKGEKKSVCFFFFFPQNMEGFCLYWSRFTAMVWSSAQSLEHTECSLSAGHTTCTPVLQCSEDPPGFQRSKKGFGIPSLPRWCGGTAILTGGILTQGSLVFIPKSPPVGLRRGQHLWAALQRAAMLGCTSLNVWIQLIQAGDFTTNSERQQSTEGAQAWSWAVDWSICEITKRWREYYFCFQGGIFGCTLFLPAV